MGVPPARPPTPAQPPHLLACVFVVIIYFLRYGMMACDAADKGMGAGSVLIKDLVFLDVPGSVSLCALEISAVPSPAVTPPQPCPPLPTAVWMEPVAQLQCHPCRGSAHVPPQGCPCPQGGLMGMAWPLTANLSFMGIPGPKSLLGSPATPRLPPQPPERTMGASRAGHSSLWLWGSPTGSRISSWQAWEWGS